MDMPLVRYVSTSDGVEIAYWTLGHGPPLVNLPPLPHSHIGLEWEFPEMRRGYELAATARTVVRYDGRGTGLSQRNIQRHSLETMLADLDAVIGELPAGEVALMGVANTAAVAIAYAARHPERVSDLILWCPVVDGSVHLENARLEALRRVMETDWELFSLAVAHALLGWSETDAARRYARLVREGITLDDARALLPEIHRLNVWDELPDVRCPTLVLHRPEALLVPPGTIERIVASIPDAQLALFASDSNAPFLGDWRAIARTIGGFLGITGTVSPERTTGRALRLLSMKGESLSTREREVVDLVARGLTNREIGEELFIAPKTVENHVGRILVKLDLHSRTELAVYAVEHGLTGRSA